MSSSADKTTASSEVTVSCWSLTNQVADKAAALGLVFCIIGFFLFAGYAKLLDAKASLMSCWGGTPIGLILSLVLLIPHELSHGLGYWLINARPKYGFVMVGATPALYTTTQGHWLTRSQYSGVAVLPLISVNILGLLLMAFVPSLRYGLVTALALHLGGCIGDIFFLWKIFHLPKETLFQDRMNGFDYYLKKSPLDKP